MRLEEQLTVSAISVRSSVLTRCKIRGKLRGNHESFPSSFFVPDAVGRFLRDKCNLISCRIHAVGDETSRVICYLFQAMASDIEGVKLTQFAWLFSEKGHSFVVVQPRYVSDRLPVLGGGHCDKTQGIRGAPCLFRLPNQQKLLVVIPFWLPVP